ncbi:MAG: hypothetical protein WCK63_04695 [Betaproteobacteria bacterium]
MSGPVSSARKYSDFGSNDGLAKALIDSFPGKTWGLKPRSLGTKIGQLDKGNVTWWAKNLDKAECLAQLLEVPLEDFGVHGKVGKGLFHFVEFPEFPPLDLKRDEPWQFADEQLDPKQILPNSFGRETLSHWLDNAVIGSWRPPHNMDWLCITDDLHRRFLSHWLSISSRHEVLFVETVADAAIRLRNPKPLIISVSSNGGDEDLTALACRPESAGILVIAPFSVAVREETSSGEWMGWEHVTTKGLEGRKFNLTSPSPLNSTLKRWVLNKLPDWRERLLIWIEKRLNGVNSDTIFSAQGMADWLHRFDPLEEWFNTTSDVMLLGRLGHLSSEKKLPAPHDLFAGDRLLQLLFAREPSSRIFQTKRLADARWHHSEVSWQGGLPLETWCSLSSIGTETMSRTELDAIVSGKTAKERAVEADRIANLIAAGNPDSLLSSGLLKEVQGRCYDFQYRTMARLLVRDGLMRQINQDSLESWAINCYDPQRRPLVDAALDAVSMECLTIAANRLAQEQQHGSAEVIGASESLFLAIGRRISKGEVVPASLFSVARSVVSRLDLTDDTNLAGPWSRTIESQDEQLDWVGACWAWSLIPNAIQDIPNNWLFPGSADTLPEVPNWLNAIWPDEECEQLSLNWTLFLKIVDQWIKDLEAPIVNAPYVALLGLLRKAGRGFWTAEASWWEQISGKVWAENALVERIKEDGPVVATRLWPSYLEFERSRTDPWRAQLSRIRYELLKQMKPAEMLGGLSEDDLRYLASIPEKLPPEARSPLLQLLGPNIPVWPQTGVFPDDFFDRFGRQIVAVLPDYLAHDNTMIARTAAMRLWAWDNQCAKRLLLEDENIGLMAKKHLFAACAKGDLVIALEALQKIPSLLDQSERGNWVHDHLPTAGVEAVKLLSLLKS